MGRTGGRARPSSRNSSQSCLTHSFLQSSTGRRRHTRSALVLEIRDGEETQLCSRGVRVLWGRGHTSVNRMVTVFCREHGRGHGAGMGSGGQNKARGGEDLKEGTVRPCSRVGKVQSRQSNQEVQRSWGNSSLASWRTCEGPAEPGGVDDAVRWAEGQHSPPGCDAHRGDAGRSLEWERTRGRVGGFEQRRGAIRLASGTGWRRGTWWEEGQSPVLGNRRLPAGCLVR